MMMLRPEARTHYVLRLILHAYTVGYTSSYMPSTAHRDTGAPGRYEHA